MKLEELKRKIVNILFLDKWQDTAGEVADKIIEVVEQNFTPKEQPEHECEYIYDSPTKPFDHCKHCGKARLGLADAIEKTREMMEEKEQTERKEYCIECVGCGFDDRGDVCKYCDGTGYKKQPTLPTTKEESEEMNPQVLKDEEIATKEEREWVNGSKLNILVYCPTCNCVTKRVCGKCAGEEKQQALREFKERVEKEVIGKNVDIHKFINYDNRVRAEGRNRLRSQQRQALQSLSSQLQISKEK